MKCFLIITFAMMFLGACSQSLPVESKVGLYEEALLRTRNVFIADRNIDIGNPLNIDFYQEYPGQLVELVFKTQKMNSSFYTVQNSDQTAIFQLRKDLDEVNLGLLKIEFDGVDVTNCIVAECNSTKCVGQETDLTGFSGSLEVDGIYLNLTKMSQSSNLDCSGLDLSIGETVHRISFKEVGTSKINVLHGARLTAQIVVFNRTHKPQDILNVVQNEVLKK